MCVCMYIFTSSLSIHLSMDTGCFHVLAIVNSATMNIRVHVSFQIRGFLFLHMWPGLGLLVVQSLSRGWLFVTSWTAARQASLSFTNSWSLLKLMSIELVMPSNHLILCRPLLLLPSILPSIRVFSKESVLCIRWPKY